MEITEYGDNNAKKVLIQPVDGHDLEGMGSEINAIKNITNESFLLLAMKIENWNADLSPWKAPAVFGKEEFGEGAERTLAEISAFCSDRSKTYYIGGYSLAGLFALWAAYRTDTFCGVAAASPSVWFPGFDTFMEQNYIKAGSVYLSLGDREEKTRNRVMATVGEKIRKAHLLLVERGVDCTLEWNEGNHFKDNEIRTARAFAWVMRRGI